MKTFFNVLISVLLIFSLAGCLYGQCIDGPCALERARMIEAIKPYGAHWVKEGMTREGRRADLSACGSLGGSEDIRFHPEDIQAARMANDPNDIAVYLRLRDRVGSCMREKGYSAVGDLKFLGGCDDRCMYP